MNIRRILSNRAYENRTWYQIVFEWEDTISEMMGVPIVTQSNVPIRIRRALNYFSHLSISRRISLSFIMDATPLNRKILRHDTIPWIIDYFLDDNETFRFIQSVQNAPIVLISSREVYDRILSLTENKPCNIYHLGLSLPDKWLPVNENEWSYKEFDLILIGRVSDGIRMWLNNYIASHGDLKIAERRIENGHYNFYSINNPDQCIGNTDTRENYFALMRKAKAFIYTTPGIDGDKKTNGYSQVTPRFLEALACGCNPVMKYPDNADTKYYDLESFCPSVNTYEEFEQRLDNALTSQLDFNKTISYLSKHVTSMRVKELQMIMNDYNNE